jgi:ubiquinone/menaquinone biosynthesis C-methylase UbiE
MIYEWFYDEFKQKGTDYNNIKEVEIYCENMQQLRDIKKEIADIIELTGLDRSKNVLEIGIGTGEFTVELSKHCNFIYGIDISEIMLDYAREKAKKRKRENIELKKAGFLSYKHEGKIIDIILTQLAFHHLPDFWKVIALKKMYKLLEKGGKLYIHDVVFSFDLKNYQDYINSFINETGKRSGERIKEEIRLHIKDEYSTFDWILESMIEKNRISYR